MGCWLPMQPQDAYGLEKLATEELCKHYTKDFGIECRIGRFHNIYGPYGTWKGNLWAFYKILKDLLGTILAVEVSLNCYTGGREKAPAAFCRKAITSIGKFEMWGDGLQTRSFTFIDECVEGVLRYTLDITLHICYCICWKRKYCWVEQTWFVSYE